MAKKNNVQPASTSVETVQGFYDSLSESITNTSIQAQELITKSVLDNEGKRQALEANQATETLANGELTKLNSILDELKSGTLASEVEAERVVNAEGIVELANSYVAKMLSDAQTVTAGLIADANLAPGIELTKNSPNASLSNIVNSPPLLYYCIVLPLITIKFFISQFKVSPSDSTVTYSNNPSIGIPCSSTYISSFTAITV